MIKAKQVQALSLPLISGTEAILVQDGPEWNNLRKFRCIAPQGLDGQTLIATRDNDNNGFSALFGAIFQIDGREKWVAVMSSPELAVQMKREEA